jgi:hypothetical protein
MTFATPLGLLALVAVPAIVAIHLFRRRYPVRRVAGLFLWQNPRQTPVEGRRRDRLPITTSLILECLAATALALILAGARLSSADIDRHLVVLLDDSASMAAVDAQGISARDRAARRIRSEVERLGASARVTLVVSGERPSVLAGPAAFAVEAQAALNNWQPQAAHHSLALGVRLARELAGTDGKLMIVSDLMPAARGEEEVPGALWASVGEALANVGIIAAERTLSPDRGQGTVSLTLGNYAGAPQSRRVVVSAGGKDIVTRYLNVPPGSSSVALPIPPGLPPVRVALSDDALGRDNSVVLAEPRPRIVAVDNRLKEGRGREALANALAAVSGITRAEQSHLVFVDGGDLDRPGDPGTWRAGFGRPPEKWRTAGAPRDFVGPFLLEKRHPLLLGVTLGGVVWAGVSPLAASAVHPLASAGDQALIGLRSASSAGESPAFLFNVDLDSTNLIRAPDWPIVISNIVEMRRHGLPGPERWNYRVGEWIRAGLGRDPKAALRSRSGGVERAIPAGQRIEIIAPSPGGLLEILEGDDVLFELGVNFLDETEGDLRRQTTADTGSLADGSDLRADAGVTSDPLFWVLLATAGLAIMANWCLLPASRVHG